MKEATEVGSDPMFRFGTNRYWMQTLYQNI